MNEPRKQANTAKHDKQVSTPRTIKLNLGGATNPVEGYENRDIKTGQPAFPLPDGDGTVDEIRASHILEHFPHEQIGTVIREWVRVLKPGGMLKIAVPDFDQIVDRYKAPGDNGPIQQWIMGGHTDKDDIHHAIFNFPMLNQLLRNAGLWRVETWKDDGADCSQLPISLNLCGIKPTPVEPIALHFVMSAPRYGFTLFQQSLCQSVNRFPGSKLNIVTGAYWGQCLERGITQALDAGATHIITLDYDSVFTYDDILELVWLTRSYPGADAIFPLQAARGWDAPLFCRKDANGKIENKYEHAEMAHNLVRMDSGHFGLTLLKAEALKATPRPWLQCVANKEGLWEDGKVDADIGFWMKWAEAKKSIYLAPHVVIGHIAEMILWPDEQFAVKPQPANQYNKTGKPAWVWR